MTLITGLKNAYYFVKGVNVDQGQGATITISGFRTEALLTSIRNHWGTSKIGANIFSKVSSHSVVMDEFFLPDLMYILKTMLSSKSSRIARRVVSDILNGLLENTWLKNTATEDFRKRFDYRRLALSSWTPLPHQLEFLRHYEEMSERYSLKGYILGAAAGSGKTGINIFKSLICGSDVSVYIVPKNSVVDVWRDTLNKFFVDQDKAKIWDSLSGKPLTDEYQYYVFHYEQLEQATTFFKKNHIGKKIDVSLDESHNFNEMKSLRTQLFIDFCKLVNAMDVLWSSGTPLKAMGSEVIPILYSIDYLFTKTAAARFKEIFGLSSSRAIDILKHRLGYMTFKIDKSAVVKNEVHTYDVSVKIPNGSDYTLEKVGQDIIKFINERTAHYDKTKKQDYADFFEILDHYEKGLSDNLKGDYAQYRRYLRVLNAGYDPMLHEVEAAFCNGFEKKNIIPNLPSGDKERFRHLKSIYKYVHLKIKGEALGRILGKARMKCNLDMLDGWGKYYAVERGDKTNKFETSIHEIIENAPSKTILFTSYVEVVDKAAKEFSDLGARPLRVYGETNSQLPSILKTFVSDKQANPLIATLKSLSTAVPMVMASDVVFLNTPFRQYEYEQASSRVNRLGQTQVVSLWNVTLDTGSDLNLSTRSSDIMQWSSDQVDAMLGITATKLTDYAALEGDTTDALDAATPIPVDPDVVQPWETEADKLETRWSNLTKPNVSPFTGRVIPILPQDVAEEFEQEQKSASDEVLATANEATASVFRRTANNPTPGTNMAKGRWTW